MASVLAFATAAMAYLEHGSTKQAEKAVLAGQEVLLIELVRRVTRLETLYEMNNGDAIPAVRDFEVPESEPIQKPSPSDPRVKKMMKGYLW